MEIIKIEGLTFKYQGADKPAIKDINLSVDEGEFILLLGPSGCGKSTLCRCLNGLIPHFYEGEISGRVIVAGMDVFKTPTYILSQYVGMVLQNPENQLFSLTVENDIAFALENLGFPRDEIRRRVDFAMDIVGIRDLKDRSPFELSGGQQQKVAIASILALMPRIIVLDEPTSSLDPLSSKLIIETISKIRKELGATVIIAEHRIELLADKVDRVLVMHDGTIVKDGKPKDVLSSSDLLSYGAPIPKVIRIAQGVNKHIHVFNSVPISVDEFEAELRRYVDNKIRKR